MERLHRRLTVSFAFLFLLVPVFSYAEEITALTDVSTSGVTIHQGDTVTRANLSEVSSSWTFHFSWPEFVPNARAYLVIFKGAFGDVEGGSLEDGLNYGVAQQQWPAEDVFLSKTFSLPALGDRSTLSGTYTAVVADAADFQGFLDWFSSGGALGTEPSNYSSLTFSYVAEDNPENLTTAIESVSVRGTVIHEGDEIYRDDLPALDTSANDLDRFLDFTFTWPNAVSNSQAVFMMFHGTFGNIEGDTPVLDSNYTATFQAWASEENTIGKYLSLAALKDPSSYVGTYTVLIAERDPKYVSGDASEEALWFASGGTEGIPPLKYSFLTFYFKGDRPTPGPGITAPVIIIPGILGSAKKHGEWVIDPILHVYDNLIETLLANGYQKDVTLFTFPYEWRDSNVDTAVLLKQKIDEVKGICSCEKVDVVAHSMGGLVARQYIQSLNYEEDVRRLVFLGTPHLGSPKAYLAWEGGELGADARSKFMRDLFTGEARKYGYSNLLAYVTDRPIYSIKELLPVYSYLENADGSSHPEYPINYPRNIFLEQLTADVDSLRNSGIQISNFIGTLAGTTTIATIKVSPSNEIDRWNDGYPEDFLSLPLENGMGDSAVPVYSSSFVSSTTQSFPYEHVQIVDKTIFDTFKSLTLINPDTIVNRGFLHRLLFFRVFSPVDFVVTAPDGKKVGKNIETGEEINEITDAFYTGFDTDDEFVTILDPLDGEYVVTTFGTGEGEYTLEASYIDDDTSTSEFFSGVTSLDSTLEHLVQLDADDSTVSIALPIEEINSEGISTPPSSISAGGGGIIYQSIASSSVEITLSTSSKTAATSSSENNIVLSKVLKGKVAGAFIQKPPKEENKVLQPKWYYGFVEILKGTGKFLSKIFTIWGL